jgi:uncharacterized protein
MQLGDARVGKLAENVVGFARTLRRAGLAIDPSRSVLAQQALMQIDLGSQVEVRAALETVFVTEQGQRPLFNELFTAYFKDPEIANKLLAQLLPQSTGKSIARKHRPRVQEALAAQKNVPAVKESGETKIQFDATMTASDNERLKYADFNQLSTGEFQLVQRVASQLKLRLPEYKTRRTSLIEKGDRPDWASYFQALAQYGDDAFTFTQRGRQSRANPLVILLDISGSMERYSRMMLTFLHAATKPYKQKTVFAFGTRLTNLTPAFAKSDPDLMLKSVSDLIGDFAGGTKLGDTIASLRLDHSRHFIGRRTTILLVSDGLDTGKADVLNVNLAWLKRHCAHLFWFNPLLRYEGYVPSATGPALLNRYADQAIAIHNLNSLEQMALGFEKLLHKTKK